MPRYTFSVRAGDDSARLVQRVELSDDTSAFSYASDLARSLRQNRENLDAGGNKGQRRRASNSVRAAHSGRLRFMTLSEAL
jgi:hypothetical protein